MGHILSYVLLGQDRLTPVVNNAGRAVLSASQKMSMAFDRAGSALIMASAAAGIASIKMASDFEESMQKIVGLVGISQRQVDQWSKQILEMSTKLPQSPKELADAMYFISSAGFRGSQAMDALKISAKASAAGLGETKTVADAVTSALNAYHGSGMKAIDATDILVAAVTAGKMPVEDLAESIGMVLGPAAEMGVSFSEVAGTAAALSRVGAPVNRTMTGIRYLLTSLAKPASQAVKVLHGIGMSADDVRKSIRERGLLATLQELKNKLPIDKFLQVVGGARGVVTALGLVGKNGKMSAQVMHDVANATGATDRAFDTAAQTTKFKLKVALNQFRVAGIQLGASLIPVVTSLVRGFMQLVGPLLRNTAALKTLIITVLAFGIALKTVGIVMQFIAAGPVGLIVLGIYALIAVIVILVIKWKTVWTAIKNAALITAKYILIGVKFMINMILSYFGFFVHAAAKLFGWVPGIGKGLKAADRAFRNFKDGVGRSLDGVIGKLDQMMGKQDKSAEVARKTARVVASAFDRQANAASKAKQNLDSYSQAVARNGAKSNAAKDARNELYKNLVAAGVKASVARRDVIRYTNAVADNGLKSDKAKDARQRLVRDIANAFNASRRGKTDIDKYTKAVVLNGTSSADARNARLKLIKDLVNTGMSSADARELVRKLTDKIKKIPRNAYTKIHMSGDGSYRISGTSLSSLTSMGGKGPFSGKQLARGGRIRGPGTSTSDSIFAGTVGGVDHFVSADEWVIRASSANRYGSRAMQAVNEGRAVIGFASGGGVGGEVLSGRYVDRMRRSHWTKMRDTMVAGMRAELRRIAEMFSGAGAVGGGVARWSGLVLKVLSLLGQPSSWLGVVLHRINQESGGNPRAINLWDSNARAGTPSIGLMQVIGPTFAAYANGFRGLGIWNPFANIFAGVNYALHRYGSLAALMRPGGYDKGGWLYPGWTAAYNGTGRRERVLGPGQNQGGDIYVTVNVRGNVLTKRELAHEIIGAIEYAKKHGNSIPK